MNLEEYFQGWGPSRRIFEALHGAIEDAGTCTVRVTRSQVAFWRRRPFAWAWVPGRYRRGAQAPLVLSVALRRRDPSSRWKEVVEPAPGRFTHHLELHSPGEIDEAVAHWLREAWAAAE